MSGFCQALTASTTMRMAWLTIGALSITIDLPKRAPDVLLADKAYDIDAIRDDLKKRGIKAVIPPRSPHRRPRLSQRRAFARRTGCRCRGLDDAAVLCAFDLIELNGNDSPHCPWRLYTEHRSGREVNRLGDRTEPCAQSDISLQAPLRRPIVL